ncbi:MAG: hypothetical protein K6G78_05550 [bacterium]|nr:hypothetical protein [bacterium]
MTEDLEELFQTPYWIIDILPKQVPAEGAGQYFAVEKHFLKAESMAAIKQRHINVVLKLNCYFDISLDEGSCVNPSPDCIEDKMFNGRLCIMIDEAMIVSEPNDTYMTIFNPSESLLEMVMAIAPAEGLFVWQP